MGKELRLGGQGREWEREEEGLEEEEKLWKFTSRKGSWALLLVGPRGGKA
jgi:hypothetical protein